MIYLDCLCVGSPCPFYHSSLALPAAVIMSHPLSPSPSPSPSPVLSCPVLSCRVPWPPRLVAIALPPSLPVSQRYIPTYTWCACCMRYGERRGEERRGEERRGEERRGEERRGESGESGEGERDRGRMG